jgi:chemotaxis protein MotA
VSGTHGGAAAISPSASEIPVDVATILGIALAWLLVIGAIFYGGDVRSFLDVPSVLIVVGGSIASTMAAFSLGQFFKLPKVMLRSILGKQPDPARLIAQLVELAEVARRDGILALENKTGEMEDPFLVRGIQMAVDGTDPEAIKAIMETEVENMIGRHERGKGLLDALSKYGPAFGMIGTLIGLVVMLRNMDDPSAIGAGMAVALLTTLYGTLMANCFSGPMADKLAVRSGEEVLAKVIIIQGVMAIQSGDNPRNVEAKLMTFIPPALRVSREEQEAA